MIRIENADDLIQCHNRYEALKANFQEANPEGNIEELLELHSFFEKLAREARKMNNPLRSKTTYAQSKDNPTDSTD
ncbi:hypothetical protein [Helicobacter bizzozeronii]|uniref:hypothetical protein n=1 Tax=Helicobacter bizzozeronii TaxID=56877 RepID=UPI000CF14CD7|nr:hypothetical protein [Helicobacter bizzozeronii]